MCTVWWMRSSWPSCGRSWYLPTLAITSTSTSPGKKPISFSVGTSQSKSPSMITASNSSTLTSSSTKTPKRKSSWPTWTSPNSKGKKNRPLKQQHNNNVTSHLPPKFNSYHPSPSPTPHPSYSPSSQWHLLPLCQLQYRHSQSLISVLPLQVIL